MLVVLRGYVLHACCAGAPFVVFFVFYRFRSAAAALLCAFDGLAFIAFLLSSCVFREAAYTFGRDSAKPEDESLRRVASNIAGGAAGRRAGGERRCCGGERVYLPSLNNFEMCVCIFWGSRALLLVPVPVPRVLSPARRTFCRKFPGNFRRTSAATALPILRCIYVAVSCTIMVDGLTGR